MAPKTRKPDATTKSLPANAQDTKTPVIQQAQIDDMDDFSKLGIAGDEALKIYPRYQRDEYRSIESTYGITPMDGFEQINGKRDAWKGFDNIAFAFNVTSNVDTTFNVRLEFMFPFDYPQVPYKVTLLKFRPRQDQDLQERIEGLLKSIPLERQYGGEYERVQGLVEAVEVQLNEAAEAFRSRIKGKSLAEIRTEDQAMIDLHRQAEYRRNLEEREARAMRQEENLKKALHLQKKRRHGILTDEPIEEEDPNAEMDLSEIPIRFKDRIVIKDPSTGEEAFSFHAVFGIMQPYKDLDKTVTMVNPVKFGKMQEYIFALKQIYIPASIASKEQLQGAMDEIRATLRTCKNEDHPHIVKVHAFQIDLDEEDPTRVEWKILILSEWSQKGILPDFLKVAGAGFWAARVRQFATQLLLALDFVEKMGHVHPALTTQNILIFFDSKDEPFLKLSDGYGTTLRDLVREARSRNANLTNARNITGFTPPEIAIDQMARTNKTSIWELAIVVIQTAFQQGYNLEHVLTSPEQLTSRDDLDRNFVDFIKVAFRSMPRNRPSASDLIAHPFLKDEQRMINIPTPENPGAIPHLLRSGYRLAQVIGSVWRRKWQTSDILGRGGFGKVVKARQVDNDQYYAVKILKCETDAEQEAIWQEVRLLAMLNHPGVVRYYHTWAENDLTDAEYVAEMSRPQIESPEPHVSFGNPPSNEVLEFDDPSIQRPIGPEYDSSDDDDGNMFGYQSPPSFSDDEKDSSNRPDVGENNNPFAAESSPEAPSQRQEAVRFVDEGSSNPFATDSKADESEPASVPQREPTRELAQSQRATLYIQMELCETATLSTLIRTGLPYRMEEVWRLFKQVLEALEHIHQFGVIHRDLKPANIFIDSRKNIKIGDFGLATPGQASTAVQQAGSNAPTFRAGMSSRGIGTMYYTAPELEHGGSGEFSIKADMFSLGVIFFQMCLPIETATEKFEYLRAISEDKDFKLPEYFEKQDYQRQARIIKALISHNQDDRPNATDILHGDYLPDIVDFDSIHRFIMHMADEEIEKLVADKFDYLAKTSRTKELAYLSKSKKSRGAWNPRMIDFVTKGLTKIFERHGAVSSERQKVPTATGFYIGSARFFDDDGTLVQLPYDLTTPFATMLADPAESHLMDEDEDFTLTPWTKYFCIGTVYRKGSPRGTQAISIPEIDYDQISFSAKDLSLKDAEVIKVLDEVVSEEPALADRNLTIYLNHGDVLDMILQSCKIPDKLFDEVKRALAHLHVSSNGWSDIRNILLNTVNKGKGLSEKTVAELAKFHLPICIAEVRDLLNRQFDEEYASRAIRPLSRLEDIVRYTKLLGITRPLYMSLLSNQSEPLYRGSVMFQCVDTRAKRIVALGGRYDKLIEHYLQPDVPKGVTRAVGFRLNTSLLYDHAQTLYIKRSKKARQGIRNDKLILPPQLDVIVTSFDEATLHGPCIEILRDLLASDIKAELSEQYRNMEELDARYPDPPTYWVVIVRPGKSSKLKVRSPPREEVEVSASALIAHMKTELGVRTIAPVAMPKLRKQASTHGESSRKVVVITPSHRSKKANRTHVVEAASAAASKLVEEIDTNAPVVALSTTDDILQQIRNTTLADGESWKAFKQSAPPGERAYLQQVQQSLEELAEEGKEGAFVVNSLTNSCIYYDFGKKI